MFKFISTPAGRGWLYGIGAALIGLLMGYGVVQAEHGGLWLTLLGAVLQVLPATALANLGERGVPDLTDAEVTEAIADEQALYAREGLDAYGVPLEDPGV